MPPKLDIKDVSKIFKDAGCILVSTVYLNNKKEMEYICSCGSENIHQITLQNFTPLNISNADLLVRF